MSNDTPRGTGIGVLKKLIFSIVFTILFFVVIEVVLRGAKFEHQPREKLLWKPTVAGFIGTFEFYIQTQFAPPGYLWVSAPNTPFTDRYGFRRPEIPYSKPPGKFRVAFLGGSTTQGGYRPYPERAIRLLNNAVGDNTYEMLNVACSSYSTHQSLIALERWVLPRDPDIVVIYHGWNEILVHSDGFSDHVKDMLLKVNTGTGGGLLSKIRGLRVTQLVGKAVDAADRNWPQQRVPFDRFRSNLEKMVEMCADKGAEAVIVVRPESQGRPLRPTTELQQEYYSKMYGTADREAIYKRNFDVTVGIQRDVAAAFDNAKVFDAAREMNALQEREKKGELGPGILVFREDAIHLYELAEQAFAEKIAGVIAPEQQEVLQRRIESYDYHKALAEEFLGEDLPYEATYHAKRAQAINPEKGEEMGELIAKAEGLYEFVRLFNEGRWGGTDNDFDSKIAKLRNCLAARPNDFGVCLQIFRVCSYSGQIPKAADAMTGFQAANPQHQYQWLTFTFQSHLAAQRWAAAEPVAREILKMNPSDQNARGFLQALQR